MEKNKKEKEKLRVYLCPIRGQKCSELCAWYDRQYGECSIALSLMRIVDELSEHTKLLLEIEKEIRRF